MVLEVFNKSHTLLSIAEYIRNSLDKNMYVRGMLIDLEKAFDTCI